MAHVLGHEIDRVAAVFDLLRRKRDFPLHAARVGEDRGERRQEQQSDGERHHELHQ
jgi:hypothetical protein